MIFKKTDDQLMKGLLDGDVGAFETLYSRHSSKVLGYCCRFLASKEKGEDIAQEVWMKIITASNRYRPDDKFLSWALTIARTSCLTELRSRGASLEVEWTENQVTDLEFLDRDAMEKELESTKDLERIKNEIDALPDQQRAALVIWMTHDFTYDEIAIEMKVSVAAVKSLLFRAKQTLEKKLRSPA